MTSELNNRAFADVDSDFRARCAALEIPASKRQAAKFRRGFGLAFTDGVAAIERKEDERKAAELAANS